MSTTAASRSRMTVPEFLAWAAGQSQRRYELVDGEIVAMAPERVRHNLVKAAVYQALSSAVKAAGVPCTVFTDGVAVVINEHTTREPDASVQCGVAVNMDSMALDAPLIVVEVTSPSSERDDNNLLLVEYFSVASIQHYLIVMPEQRVIVQHQRLASGEIATRIARDGAIVLNPPGIEVAVVDLLGPAAEAVGGDA